MKSCKASLQRDHNVWDIQAKQINDVTTATINI